MLVRLGLAREVAQGDDAHEAFVSIEHGKPLHLEGGHVARGILDLLVLVAILHIGRHDIAHRAFAGRLSFRNRAHHDVSVADHTDKAVLLAHRYNSGVDLDHFLRDFLDGAPDELTTFAVFATCPPHEPFPAHLHGQPVFLIVPCWSGPQDEGERLLRPLREFGPPEADLVGPLPYPIFQSMLDGTAPWGLRHYGKSDFLGELDDEAIDVLVDRAAGLPGPLSQVLIAQLGGAVARVSPDATAFGNRGAGFFYHSIVLWTDPEEDADQIAWARSLWQGMRPHSAGVYVNFLAEDEGRLDEVYGTRTFERLTALKEEFDPTNALRLNHNIAPGRS